MEQLTQFRIISLGLQVLLLFIGALTLGIAGIGLMNIMLVSVQQRTREIGVEKALGARKRHILLQFLAEALVISGVGGVGGIALAYVVATGRQDYVLQRAGFERGCRRYSSDHLAEQRIGGDGDSGDRGDDQRDDSCDEGGEPRSD